MPLGSIYRMKLDFSFILLGRAKFKNHSFFHTNFIYMAGLNNISEYFYANLLYITWLGVVAGVHIETCLQNKIFYI